MKKSNVGKIIANRVNKQKQKDEDLKRQEEKRLQIEDEERKKRDEIDRIEKEEIDRLKHIRKALRDKKKNEDCILKKEQDRLAKLFRYGIKINKSNPSVIAKDDISSDQTVIIKNDVKSNQPIIVKDDVKSNQPIIVKNVINSDQPIIVKDDVNSNQPIIVKNEVNSNQPIINSLRSPILCVMGHVDVGKTKLLDKLRHTNVQENEAGGITQQIGATWFPIESLHEKISNVSTKKQFSLDIPGLLIIDTPGHESFSNLRSRGSNLCDIAILVVDIMHGIEGQTIESIQLLQSRNIPFIVALNKIDCIYGWRKSEWTGFNTSFKKQTSNVTLEFKKLLNRTIVHFSEQNINTKLYKEIKNFDEWVALVPISAHTGEGIPDLLLLITQYTQRKLKKNITYDDKFEAIVLEVKPIEGFGNTIDVIIVNGIIRKGDKIVLSGLNGPITTNIKLILTPHPLRELRVKNEYLQHDMIKASQGVKIVANGHDLEDVVPGSSVFIVRNDEEYEHAILSVTQDYEKLRSNLNKDKHGIYVNSSTLGSLEALLSFLKTEKIPVSDFSVGPVHKRDVIKAGMITEKNYRVILAFDVKITLDAEIEAKKLDLIIMTSDIIYRLTDQFKVHSQKIEEQDKNEHSSEAIWPCVLEIIPKYIFNKKNPIVIGVKVLDGELRRGTAICVPDKYNINLGIISNIQFNNKDVEIGKKGMEVAISIASSESDQHYSYERHFTSDNKLVSKISRQSIDVMKKFFPEDVSKYLDLFKKLKKLFHII